MYLGLLVVVLVLRLERDRALKVVMHPGEIETLVVAFG